MMPLWIFTLGREMLREANVRIPYINLTVSLVSLTLTLAIGLAIQKYKPVLAAFLKKIMKPLTAVIMTIVIIGGSLMSLYIIPHLSWNIVAAGLSCAMAGYVLGAVVAALFNLNRNQIVAVSIETALQNPGVAFVLLTLSLKQPDSDLAAIPVVAQLFMTGIPMWITYLFYFCIKSLKKRIRKGKNAKERKHRLPAIVMHGDAETGNDYQQETDMLPV
jgi:sodium/bile acid cotransporter 3/5